MLIDTILTIFGAPVSGDDARALLAILVSEGNAPAMAVAARIGLALERGARLVGLEPRQRDAVLAILEDPPDALNELRSRLVDDAAQRHRLA